MAKMRCDYLPLSLCLDLLPYLFFYQRAPKIDWIPRTALLTKWSNAGNTKGGSITVPLTSCLTSLDQSVLQIKTKIVSCHTADSKLVKQEVNGTVILPPLVFPVQWNGTTRFAWFWKDPIEGITKKANKIKFWRKNEENSHVVKLFILITISDACRLVKRASNMESSGLILSNSLTS
jgi:hypothetical protein